MSSSSPSPFDSTQLLACRQPTVSPAQRDGEKHPAIHGFSRKESLREVVLSAASSTGRSRLPASSSHRLAGSLGQGAGDGVGHEAAAQGEDCSAPQGRSGVEESIADEASHDGYQVRWGGSSHVRPVC